MKRLLLTGASGFVGTAVTSYLAAQGQWQVRALAHRRTPGTGVAEITQGDLGRPETLRGIAEGVDAALHVASHISDDETACQAVNVQGTEALIAELRRAGVRRLIYLSNASVCGWSVHRGSTEAMVPVRPVTPISRSREAAERAVLAAGGAVVRPLFVYGVGDTRFIPTVDAAVRRWRFVVSRGAARISVIAVQDLARALVGLLDLSELPSEVLHATDGQPVVFRDLLQHLARELRTPAPRVSLPWPLARALVRIRPGRLGGGAGTRSAEHRLFLVSRDHFFDSQRLWRLLGTLPPAPFHEQFADSVAWYREQLMKPRSK